MDHVTESSTVRHVRSTLKNITEKLNPGQSPVFTGDQPVYILGKQIQWLYPDEFKNSSFYSRIWLECLLQNNPSVEISQWGWVVEEGMAFPYWSTLPMASEACKELKTCKCSRRCDTNACQCREYWLPCTGRVSVVAHANRWNGIAS